MNHKMTPDREELQTVHTKIKLPAGSPCLCMHTCIYSAGLLSSLPHSQQARCSMNITENVVTEKHYLFILPQRPLTIDLAQPRVSNRDRGKGPGVGSVVAKGGKDTGP